MTFTNGNASIQINCSGLEIEDLVSKKYLQLIFFM